MPITRAVACLIGAVGVCACAQARPSVETSTELGCRLGGYRRQTPRQRRATLPEAPFGGVSAGLLVAAYDAHGGAPRYGALRAAVPNVSNTMLVELRKELEAEGVLTRTVGSSTPVRVEGKFTDTGQLSVPTTRGVS